MKHIIYAQHGDKITIHIQAKPKASMPAKPYITRPTKKHYDYVQHVCDALQITQQQLQGKRGGMLLTTARQYLAHYLKTTTLLGVTQIAKMLHKHHSTIIHSIAQYHKLAQVNDEILTDIIIKIQAHEKN